MTNKSLYYSTPLMIFLIQSVREGKKGSVTRPNDKDYYKSITIDQPEDDNTKHHRIDTSMVARTLDFTL